MTETTMPAAEAEGVVSSEERISYELAFHVLPTVAEGEVTTVFDQIKAIISQAGGELGVEEAPKRFELAYEIIKRTEGKNRRYTSAYFGWVRFTAPSSAVTDMMIDVESHESILRALLVKLTKAEEEFPFYFHEALQSDKKVVTIDEAPAAVKETAEAAPAETSDDSAADAEESAKEETAEAEVTDEKKEA